MYIGYLQRQDRFADCILIGPAETDIRHVTRPDSEPLLTSLPWVGWFGAVGRHTAMLYRFNSVLRFRLDDQPPVNLDDVTTSWVLKGRHVRFKISSTQGPLLDIRYRPSDEFGKLEDDPTPFVEAEHFDFFLFVHNVLTTPGRRERLLEALR
jgi:hypothetical protein